MADRSRVCGLWRVLRIIIVCGMTAIEIGEGALRARGRHVDRGRTLYWWSVRIPTVRYSSGA